MKEVEQRPAGRPRDEATRDRILKITLEQVATRGYVSLTIKDIADQAKVGRQTIYRWWATKAEVVLEAVLENVAQLKGDQSSPEAFLKTTFALARGAEGEAVVGVMADAQRDTKLHVQVKDRLTDLRRASLKAVIERYAAGRGSTYAIAVDDIVDMLFGAMWYRLLDKHGPLNDAFAEELSKALDCLLKQK
ncbi:MAG: TetR/AcrR family transcriptional regulator [Candidatus Saccharibacteria bacterium]